MAVVTIVVAVVGDDGGCADGSGHGDVISRDFFGQYACCGFLVDMFVCTCSLTDCPFAS